MMAAVLPHDDSEGNRFADVGRPAYTGPPRGRADRHQSGWWRPAYINSPIGPYIASLASSDIRTTCGRLFVEISLEWGFLYPK